MRQNHAKYISTQAKDDVHYYIHNEVGYNYRMTNLQGALGVAQMEELPEFIERKQKNYSVYRELLQDSKTGYLLPFREGTESNKWFYSYVLDRNVVKAELRDIITELEKEGVQTRAIWGLIHEQKPYVDCTAFQIKKAKEYSRRVINLPCSTNLKEEVCCCRAGTATCAGKAESGITWVIKFNNSQYCLLAVLTRIIFVKGKEGRP